MAKKAIILIPIAYNAGSRVPQELLREIYAALFAFSGGHSSAGTVHGAYRMPDGSKQTEVLEQVWVAYEEEDRQELRALVGRLCALLGQETMYLEFTESVIEFIPPTEE